MFGWPNITSSDALTRAREDGTIVISTTPPARAGADELLRQAHESVYRWPGSFPGFSATIRIDGIEGGADGTVQVPSSGAPSLRVDGREDVAWARRELASMASHRRHLPYEDADGRHPKSLRPDDGSPLGRLVVLEDALHSAFRLQDGRVREISRRHRDGRFTLQLQAWEPVPDGRWLATAFTALHFPPEGDTLVGADVYRDAYVAVDGLMLPAARQVVSVGDAGVTVRSLGLGDHVVAGGGK